MISDLELKNFKCFENLQIDLKNVNVFAGVNGVGKSTVIQALLLIRQSFLADPENRRLYLNGKYAEMGNSQDVVYDKAQDDFVEINLTTSHDRKHTHVFAYEQDTDYLQSVKSAPDEREDEWKNNSLYGDNFVYLSAYRINPQEHYGIISEKDLKIRSFGNNGEFALQYLGMYGDEDVKNPCVVEEDAKGKSLINQVRIWLDRVSPGVSPQIKVMMDSRVSELAFDFVEGKEKTNSYKSINVGFGITYFLPVIVALLSSKPGDLIMIENPEAHIHPAGQRMLGELIARAGAGGAQIMVETHSEHIINGVRISVKEDYISKDDVQLAFFYKDAQQEYRHTYQSVQIFEDGKLSAWPDGFLDEWEKALIDLL